MDIRTSLLRAPHARNPVLASAVLAALAACSPPARAGDSYLSIQGTFAFVNVAQNFDFSLGANSLLIGRTWGSPGGINAAGEVVPGNGADTLLGLYNAQSTLLGSDDDGGGGLNSLISNLFAPGNYYFKLQNPFSQG